MFAVKKYLNSRSRKDCANISTRGILAVLCLATTVNALAVSSVNIVLPALIQDLGTTYGRAQWAIISFVTFLTATLAVAGRVSDRIGRTNIFVVGVVIFTLSALCCGISTHIWMLVFFRALQGMGAAMFVAVAMAIASDTFPKSRAGTAIGLLGSASAVGTGTGPVLGGLLLEVFSWQSVFLVQASIGMLIFLLAKRVLPDDAGVRGATIVRPQLEMPIFIGVFSAVLFYTLSIKPLNSNYGAVNVIAAALSGVALLSLLVLKRRLSRTFSPVNASQWDYSLWGNLAGNLLVGAAVMSSQVVAPFYLTMALGLDFSRTGLVMSAGSFSVAIFAHVAGRLVDRFKSRLAIFVGLGLMVSGALGVIYLELGDGVPGYLLYATVTAAGYGTYLSSNNAFTMHDAGAEQRGNISGLLNLSRNLGLLTGVSIMGVVFAVASGLSRVEKVDPTLVVAGLNQVYVLALLLLVLAVVIRALVAVFDRDTHGSIQ
ncbi:MFS transporter [Microbulbifer sp. 2201CG32-9]|uniref:MFS transporter n=1 Tax=Microbulbifer sp. 2201CG32-9 TaxID=3232309 RepID=UPI00345B8975